VPVRAVLRIVGRYCSVATWFLDRRSKREPVFSISNGSKVPCDTSLTSSGDGDGIGLLTEVSAKKLSGVTAKAEWLGGSL
jgi:hypothetical protein